MIPAEFATGLGDSNWKTRLATLEEMTGWVESSAESLDSEVVVRFLGKKGWSEKNFQVCTRLLDLGSTLITHLGLSETVRHPEFACGTVSVIRKILRGAYHPAFEREARRHETEETSW